MKTVRPRFVRAHSLGHNSSMGASYQAKCPHCGHRNLAWGGEWRDRKPDRTNKCVHFDGFTKAGAFRFLKGLPIVKGVARWYRCVYCFPYGEKADYYHGSHASAVDQWYEEAHRFNDYVDTGDIEATVLAVKAPPAEWLAKARLAALERVEGATRAADFLRMELARHYPNA